MTRPLPHEAERHVDHPDGRRTADVAGVDVPRTGGLRALDGTTHVTMRDPTVRVHPAARHGRPEPVRHPHPHTAPFLFTQGQHDRIAACRTALDALPAPLAVELPRVPTDGKGAPDHDQGRLAAFVEALEAAVDLCVRHHTALEQLQKLRELVNEASRVNPGSCSHGGALQTVVETLPRREDHPSDAAWVEALEQHVTREDGALRERIALTYRTHLTS